MSNERPPTRRARQQLRRRRREQIAGAVVVVLGVVVAIIAVIALQQPGGRNRANGSQSGTVTLTKAPGSSSAAPSASQSRRRSSAAPSSGSSSSSSTRSTAELRQTPLVVLNNTTISGLARSAADSFTSGGWTVTRYGNYQNNILSTCAYYDAGTTDAKAAAMALREQFPGIQRVEPKFGGLPAGPIVVVLTSGYSTN